MLTIRRFQRQCAFLAAAIVAIPVASPALAELPAQLKQDDKTIAWMPPNAKPDDLPVWRFSFDSSKGKTFFQPLTVAGSPELTNYKPQDHPWHYGLWFSWKYINHVNYWEEDPKTGNAVNNTFGKTTWKAPDIAVKPNGQTNIKLEVSYTSDKGVVAMRETREIVISALAPDGSYKIDWRGHFTAGKDGADLDRTPMPGEPNGAVNGGYAGIGLRMAGNPLKMKVTSTIGPIDKFESSRARPACPAIACNFTRDDKPVGSIALFSDPANTDQLGNGKIATWYIINDDTQNNGAGFRFACPSILAPKVVHVDAGKTIDLHYQFFIAPQPFTPDSLKAEQEAWLKAK
jgi:hypothetical protein